MIDRRAVPVVIALALFGAGAFAHDSLPLLLELRGHAAAVAAVAFSPNGTMLLSAGGFFTGPLSDVRVWDPSTGKILRLMSLPGWSIEAVAFSPDGRLLAVGGATGWGGGQGYFPSAKIIDTATGQLLHTLTQPGANRFKSLAFTPDGQHLVTCAPPVLTFWDVDTGDVTHSWTTEHGSKEVAFSPTGAHLASGSGDGTVEILNVSSGEVWVSLPGFQGGVFSLAYSSDGALLAAGYFDGTVTLWDAKFIGLKLRSLSAHTGVVRALAFSPDGRLLVSGGGMTPTGELRIWDPLTGRPLLALTLPGGPVYSVAFSPDGRLLATGSDDGVVRVWDVSTVALP